MAYQLFRESDFSVPYSYLLSPLSNPSASHQTNTFHMSSVFPNLGTQTLTFTRQNEWVP